MHIPVYSETQAVTRLPRICLLYTGGTIGMIREPDGVIRPPASPSRFLDVAPELKNFVSFDFVPLMNKDSTNMTPGDWTVIAHAIYTRLDKGYTGFLVAHGTDTMHFSASAVSFALGSNLNCPVVFTGSQTIPEVAHGDARVNLLRAAKVATEDIAEVVIVFGEFVFRGCRAQKKDERRFDAFESPAEFPLGYVTESILLDPRRDLRRGPKSEGYPPVDFRADFAEGVLQVSLIPGLEPHLVESALEAERCRGVILQSFGAGNVPDEDPYAFTGLIERARDLCKPVVITSQFPANATLHASYAPGRAAVAAGAIPTGNMTASCAVAKFRWVLAQVDGKIREGKLDESDRIDMTREMMGTIFVREMDSGDGGDN